MKALNIGFTLKKQSLWTTSSNNYTANPQTHAHWENEIQRAILNAIGTEQVLLDSLLSETGILMTKLAMELMTFEIEGLIVAKGAGLFGLKTR